MQSEAFALVASDLGISIRHLFRDRAIALLEITSRILKAEAHSVPATFFAPSATDALVRSAEALVQCGSWRRAADMLENAVENLPDDRQRARVRLSLGELYLEAGRVNLARPHIEAQVAMPEGALWQTLYAQILHARLAYSSGDARAAEAPLRKSLRSLRQLTRQSPCNEVLEALARSLAIQTDLDFKLGKIADAVASSTEALDALATIERPDPFLNLSTRTGAALSHLFSWTNIDAAELELVQCYEEAIGRGYLRESVMISTHLSAYYRLCKQLDRSLQIVHRALPTARAVGAGEALGGLLTELGWTLLLTAQFNDALTALSEARSHFASNWELEAVTELLCARAWAGLGCADLALIAAENVEMTFTQLGRRRLAGASLIVQAEALHQLRRTDAARRTARAAFSVLQSALGKRSPALSRAENLIRMLEGRPKRSARP